MDTLKHRRRLILIALLAIVPMTSGCEWLKQLLGIGTVSGPDLIITEIKVEPVQPQASQPFTLTVRVKNAGTAESGEYDLLLYIRDISRMTTYPIGTFRRGRLQAGQDIVAWNSADTRVNDPGSHQVNAEIRPFVFTEANVENNKKVFAFEAR